MIQGRLSDAEWAFFEPFVIETRAKRGRPPSGHWLVLDGIFWIARTVSPWRVPDALQMVDSTVVREHHCAAGVQR